MSTPRQDPTEGWKQQWSVTCDFCLSTVQVTTTTDHPDENAARQQMVDHLHAIGWAINPPSDACPECLAKRGSTFPQGGDQHYMQYYSNESGITAVCSCHWQATSPGLAGAQMAAAAHRRVGEASSGPTQQEWK